MRRSAGDGHVGASWTDQIFVGFGFHLLSAALKEIKAVTTHLYETPAKSVITTSYKNSLISLSASSENVIKQSKQAEVF